MTKTKSIIIAGILLLLFFITTPLWLWQLKPAKELNVLIVDKTVPDQSYREHKGIVWLLNHLKIKKTENVAYDLKEDYVGFVPTNQPPKFQTRTLPEDLSTYNVLYVADSYGVYEDEYISENKEGNRSNLLYGGMTTEEIHLLKDSLMENHQTLIAEFNTFGSPTEQEVKEEFYELLNVRWTGWMGRYFNDLSNNEVPDWLKQNYEKQYGKSYTYKGSGIVFVNEDDEVLVLTKKDLSSEHIMFNLTENGLNNYDIKQNIPYNYWFDIVDANEEKEVQAKFELSLSSTGAKKLEDNKIPLSFPAVIHHENQLFDSYYFAGDFADQEKVPAIYQISGLTSWQKMFSFEKKGRTDTFFWKAYVPMMTNILTTKKATPTSNEAVEPEIKTIDDMNLIGRSGDEYIQVYRNGAWEDLLIKGVNMGIAKPGSFPGETKITKQEYARWFEQISEMNANALRVYTIHPPAFYEALYEHNRYREDPIYLLHGVWVNEETFLEKKNAYDPAVTNDFQEEIQRTVDLIHGNADLEERAGHASGKYDYDLSPYLLGWIIGVEWDPEGVVGTNEKNTSKTSYDGTYMMVENVSPFESWLAEMMDFTAIYEAENYKWQHPISFTNWVTTDLLEHPSEPNIEEDLVSVNPNVIKAKEAFYPGLFASYHIYPYYPDFLNYEKKYVEYVDHRGEKNNYAGYLHDMKESHDLPLLVAEFGIPASRGLTHENIYGFDQGNHSEQEQGQYLKSLFEDIVHEEMAGGLVFSWHDEWFKRTWNTMDYDNPDRRPFWDNIQTNEQHFGLLSFEPDTEETQLQIDGNKSDWEARNEEPIQTINDHQLIKNVYMSSDARGLYIRMDYDQKQWNEDEVHLSVLLDTINNQGQSVIPDISEVQEEGIDFLVQLQGKDHSKVLIDSYYDTFYYDYGHILKMIPSLSYANKKNNGVYHPIQLTLNKKMSIDKVEGTISVPFSSYETGKLHYGNGNPTAEDYNSLSDFYMKDGIIELRLPWLLLNVKDPSRKEIIGDIWSKDGINSSETIDGISAKIIVSNSQKEVVQSVPQSTGSWMNYSWDNWDEPLYHERLKKSYDIMQDAFKEAKLDK
ncbi:hypothetical protein ACIQ34_10460 [Ureibacillus sp. NPDC094379]